MMTLTGRTRFRPYVTDNDVLLVLQVEVAEPRPLPENIGMFRFVEWRDATIEDLCEVQHLTYSNIHLSASVQLPEPTDAVPGDTGRGRKLH